MKYLMQLYLFSNMYMLSIRDKCAELLSVCSIYTERLEREYSSRNFNE